MEEKEIVELTNLGRGALVERFNDALAEVFENCLDINTIQKRMRKVKLEVVVLPNEERTAVATQIRCESVLAPVNPVETILFIGKRNGRAIGVEHDPEQQQLFKNDGQSDGQPVELREAKKND